MNLTKEYCTAGRPIGLLSNFFKFELKSSNSCIQKYSLNFSPSLPESQGKLRERVARKASTQISEIFGKWVFANTTIYAVGSSDSGEAYNFTATFDNVEYTLTIAYVGAVTDSLDTKAFYNKFFNSIQGKLNLVMIGRKFYNPDRSIDLSRHKLSIWPGYASSVGSYEAGSLINIDISHRCLRTESVYDQLEEVRRKGGDFKLAFSRLIIGTTVLTLYNKKTYRVDEIMWDLNPQSSFTSKTGEQTFLHYYNTRWSQQIRNPDQPLLKGNVRGMECLLVPEFCVVSGLTDAIRADFNIMKDMAQATKKEPHVRLKESAGLIEALYKNPAINNEIQQWRADISPSPVGIEGRVLAAEDIMMGGNKRFRIGDNGSFDRDVQNKMFEQPMLKTWGVFFVESDRRLVENTMNTLQQVIKTYQIDCKPPGMFPVSSDRWSDWDCILQSRLNPDVQVILCVLPGNRGKSKLYDDLKRLTFTRIPVPTQVVLNATLKKDKGIRSILNKIIIQINAKVGGVPWVLKDLPLGDQPTMIMGIDIYHKAGSYSVLGMCATTDSYFAKYVSLARVNAPGEEVCSKLEEAVSDSIDQFISANHTPPLRIVVFRDGVSDSQKSAVLNSEVSQFISAFEKKSFSISLVYVIVNKRVNARFYANEAGKVNNPPIGTCIDREVVTKDDYEFYLMPARATQGAMTPTAFRVIYDTSGIPTNELQKLTYRLCYAYYNWSGSIRVPAPCQYAHKLAYMLGERSTSQGPPVPHQHWHKTRSLYFL